MALLITFRKSVAKWPKSLISILGAIAAFGCYTCMYAFRKSFAAGTFENQHFLGIDYKVCLVIAQMIGYTVSKFYGIKFIAQKGKNNQAKYILILIGVAWFALLGFAIVPAPYNIAFLLLNGFPLGMIWGLVFSYLEGRRTTEFMGAVMSISLIFASGFVKTIGRNLMAYSGISEFWMPFLTGLLFVLPLLIFVLCLELLPEPGKKDQESRTERVPMNAQERKRFLLTFLPGIVLTLIIYIMLTCIRDMRDNFEVEIWNGLGIRNNHIYTQIDTAISIVILAMMGLLILIKNNLKAFKTIHYMIISGCVLVGISTLIFNFGYIGPITWMALVGMGLYMAYIPYNAIFFERMIASFHYKSNIGFIMYLADSAGYVGSFSILLFHEFGNTNTSWAYFFKECLFGVAIIGTICSVGSLIYFKNKAITCKEEVKAENVKIDLSVLELK